MKYNNDEEIKDFGIKKGRDLFFQFQEGENKVRILTEGYVIGSHFFGKGIRPSVCYGIQKGCPFHEENNVTNEKKEYPNVSIKYTVYLLDKADNTIKIADLPSSVNKKIEELKKDEDYSFETFPMPYDIKITKSRNGDKTEYSIIASPKREEISTEISSELKEKIEKYPIKETIQKKKDNQIQDHKERGLWISPEMHKEAYDKRTAQINAGKDEIPTIQVEESVEEYVNNQYPENNLGSGPQDF